MPFIFFSAFNPVCGCGHGRGGVRKMSLDSLWTRHAGSTWVPWWLGLGRLAHFRGQGSWLWIPTSTVEQGLTHWCHFRVVRTSDRCRFETVGWSHKGNTARSVFFPGATSEPYRSSLKHSFLYSLPVSTPYVVHLMCKWTILHFILFSALIWGHFHRTLSWTLWKPAGSVISWHPWARGKDKDGFGCVTFFKKALTPLQRRMDIWDTRQAS